MAKQRMVSTRFWSDPWVVDELNPLDRYLFLYLLTNEKTNVAGVYEMSLRTMSNETGIEREELSRMMNRLESRVVYVLGWVVFKKAIKHQNYGSPKIVSAMVRELANVPQDVITYIDFPVNLGKLLHEKYGIDTVSAPIPNLTKLNLTKPIPNPNVATATIDEPKGKTSKTKEIDGMFLFWSTEVGYSITSKAKQNREYAGKLLKDYDKHEIALMIRAAGKASEDQYAPGVSDFIDLYRKWDKLKLWGKKKGINHGKQVADLTV